MFLPPFLIKNPSIFSFVFEGDEESIQKELVDPILSEPGKSDFEVLFSGKFLAIFIHHNHLASIHPEENLDWVLAYKEVTIFIGVKHRRTGRKFWFTPTMHLDSFPAIAVGRDLYGLPKSWGKISMPAKPQAEPMSFLLQSEVFCKTHDSPTSVMDTIFEINSSDESESQVSSAYQQNNENTIAEFFASAFKFWDSNGFVTKNDHKIWDALQILQLYSVLAKPGIFLKQLPEADRSGHAAFQQLIEARYAPSLKSLPQMKLLRGFQGKFFDYDSFQMASSLGVPANQSIPSPIGIWLTVDFIAKEGKQAKL